MRTICVASQKGGSGKSTISAHLSVEASKQLSVAIVDTDNPQGSLAQWWNVRKADTPVFIREYAPDLEIDLKVFSLLTLSSFQSAPHPMIYARYQLLCKRRKTQKNPSSLSSTPQHPAPPSPMTQYGYWPSMGRLRRSPFTAE